MRKTLVLIMLAALLLSALCACGSKSSPVPPPQSISAVSPEFSALENTPAAETAEQAPSPQALDDVT